MSELSSIEYTFLKASEYVSSSPASNTSSDVKLLFYANYKQAVLGDVCIPEPRFLDFEGRAKYKAWASLKGTSKEKAMLNYIRALQNSNPTWHI